jgi:sensor histidine kinase YesM
MIIKLKPITRQSVLRALFITSIFNTLIAIFLTILESGGGFLDNFIFSQSIGISICSCVMAAYHVSQKLKPVFQLILVAAAVIVGSVVGAILGALVAGINPLIFLQKHAYFIRILLLGVMFGSIITYIFTSWHRIELSEAQIQEERIKRLTSEKQVAETSLKVLQARIEPHFLFNTLSNILSLMDTDQVKAKSMLGDFIQYLRKSISKIREDSTTLGQEIEMIRAYLNLFKVRMGNRLHYRIDLPKNLEDFPFPPMLIQPLVENAIKHGLDSRVEGGEILIRGEEKDGIVRLEVVDTGLGFKEDRESGVGLANVRDRLQLVYRDRGRLIIEENQPHGLKAILEVPYGRT